MMFSDPRHSSKRRHGPNSRGLTLVEVMIAMTVIGILLAFAVPSFRDAALGSSLSAIANNLYASVQLARSEAIKRNVPVTMCRSADGATCAGSGDWEQGWIVTAGSTVIQHKEAVASGFKVLRTVGTGSVTFQPIGVGATAATFKVCRATPAGNQERVVTVGATGIAHITRTETGTCS